MATTIPASLILVTDHQVSFFFCQEAKINDIKSKLFDGIQLRFLCLRLASSLEANYKYTVFQNRLHQGNPGDKIGLETANSRKITLYEKKEKLRQK